MELMKFTGKNKLILADKKSESKFSMFYYLITVPDGVNKKTNFIFNNIFKKDI